MEGNKIISLEVIMNIEEVLPIRCDECGTVISSRNRTQRNQSSDCLIKQITIDCENETLNVMYWCPVCGQSYVIGFDFEKMWKRLMGNQLNHIAFSWLF